MRWNGDLGNGWQCDAYGPGELGSNVTAQTVIYHQGSDDCDIACEEWTATSVRVECSCGEVYTSEKAEP